MSDNSNSWVSYWFTSPVNFSLGFDRFCSFLLVCLTILDWVLVIVGGQWLVEVFQGARWCYHSPERTCFCFWRQLREKQIRLIDNEIKVIWGALVTQSAEHLTSDHDLTAREFKPCVGLCAASTEPRACFGFCVSVSLCPSPAHSLCLSLSKINKH